MQLLQMQPYPFRLLVSAVILLPLFVTAGAWRQKPGTGTAVANFSYLQAASYSDGKGQLHDLDLIEIAATVYGSYGVFENLSMGAALAPHKILITDDHTVMGISDLEMWCDHHLASMATWQFAMRYAVVFPIGLENPAWVPDDFYAIHSQGALGLTLYPMVGYSHGNFWIQAGAGAKLRGRDLASQGKFQIDAGGKLGRPWLSGRLGISGLMPLDSQSNGMPSDQEAYLGDQLAVEFRLPQLWRLGLQFDSMIPPGQVLPQGLRSNIYLGWSWN